MWSFVVGLVASGFAVGTAQLEPKSLAQVTSRETKLARVWKEGPVTLKLGDDLRVTKGKVRLKQLNGVIQTWVPTKLYVGGKAPRQVIRDERRFRVVYRLSSDELSLRAQLSRLDVALTKGNEFFLYPDAVLVPPKYFHVVTVNDEGPTLEVRIAQGRTIVFEGPLSRQMANVYSSAAAQSALAKIQTAEPQEISVSPQRAGEPVVFRLAPTSYQLVEPDPKQFSSPVTFDLAMAYFFAKNGLIGLYRGQRDQLKSAGIDVPQ